MSSDSSNLVKISRRETAPELSPEAVRRGLMSGQCYVFPDAHYVAQPGIHGLYVAALRMGADYPDVLMDHIRRGYVFEYVANQQQYVVPALQSSFQKILNRSEPPEKKFTELIQHLQELSERYVYPVPEWFTGLTGLHILPDRFSHPALHQGDHPEHDSISEAWRRLQRQETLDFRDNYVRSGGTLRGVIGQLPYFGELGVDFIYLGPVFDAESAHGFDAHRFIVHPQLAGYSEKQYDKANRQQRHHIEQQGLTDYVELVESIPVIQDIALNHVGQRFWAFEDVRKHGRSSHYADWFRGLQFDGRGRLVNWRGWWGYPEYVELNYHCPEVGRYFLGAAFQPDAKRQSAEWSGWVRQLKDSQKRQRILGNATLLAEAQKALGVIGFWSCLGIRGWRLDVPNDVNRWEFWREFRQLVKLIDPEIVLIAECWDNEEEAQWLWGGTFDAVMNYNLLQTMLDFLVGRHGRRMEHLISERAQEATAQQFAQRVTRLMRRHPPQVVRAMMNNAGTHDLPRVADLLGGDLSLIKIYFTLMATMPGNLTIWAGDELGMNNHGANRAVDPMNRKPYDWRAHARREQLAIFRYIRELISLRHYFPILASEQVSFIEPDDGDIVVFVRGEGVSGDHELLVIVNRGSTEKLVRLPTLASERQEWRLVLGSEEGIEKTDEGMICLPCRSCAVYVMMEA